MYRILLLVVATILESSRGQLCDWVMTRNCSSYAYTPECSTNGVTYDNTCLFAKDQCKDSNLHIQAHAPCAHAGHTTHAATGPSTSPGPIFLGHNVVRDFFCLELGKDGCAQSEPVCGTDNNTYPNYCEFEKQKCTHTSLDVKNFGAC